MTVVAAAAVVVAFVAAVLVAFPASRRTGLEIWHPAIAWLALEAVFFGIGSAILAVGQGRVGPAWDVAASVLAFGAAVAVSDRLTHGQIGRRPAHEAEVGPGPAIRWPVVLLMIAAGIAVLAPTLLSVGIPAFATDVTGARTAIGGLDVQVLRVAVPAALVAAVVLAAAGGSQRPGRVHVLAWTGVAIAVAAEIALASRYLAAELAAAVVIGLALAGRPLAGRLLAAGLVAGAVLFAVVGVLRAYGEAAEDPLGFAVDRSVNRILLIEPRTLDAIQTAIPEEVPYFGGLTWIRRLAPLLGRDDVPNLGYWIYPRLFPDQTVPGYAAPGILGEAWANFGPIGVVVPAALGVLAERLGAFVAIRRRSAADVAAGALAILFLARTHAVGLTGLTVLIVLVVAWRLLAAPIHGLRADVARTLRWQA